MQLVVRAWLSKMEKFVNRIILKLIEGTVCVSVFWMVDMSRIHPWVGRAASLGAAIQLATQSISFNFFYFQFNEIR